MKLWIESKGPTVDPGTAERYADALDDHVLPALGLFFYDQLTSLDVQKWVNTERRKGYRAETIKGWFRVLRTMTRHAIDPLGLPRDPDPARWDMKRLAVGNAEDETLASAGLDAWAGALDAEVPSFRRQLVYVEFEAGDVFRIIGARKATPHERKAYESK